MFLALLLKLFFCTIATICQATIQQILPIFAIYVQTLCLAIRAVLTAHVNALIPIDAKPFEISELVFFPAFYIPLYIGIFNPNNKFPTVMSCE
ncbi:hypothetical protein D1872_305510 [compost metagenome]